MIVTGWRLASSVFASKEEMLSGDGAFRYGGRWNSAGVRVVYLGSSLAQAAMELLVHMGRADIIRTYCKMPVYFDPSLMIEWAPEQLPQDWMALSLTPPTQIVGDQWVASQDSLILKIPSAAVMGEYNYVINVEHADFSKLSFGDLTRFDYDPRLDKQNSH